MPNLDFEIDGRYEQVKRPKKYHGQPWKGMILYAQEQVDFERGRLIDGQRSHVTQFPPQPRGQSSLAV